ncbi:MAG: putative transport system permease protein [Acidobacteriota bacterium]|nr:putative transport system permease protein [Acidobacteriota bacterium]
MFKNYLKVAFRNVFRHKIHSFINIAGLAIGMAACLLLSLWLLDELSYDRYHENADRIYRVVYEYQVEGGMKRIASTPAPLGPALVNEFPAIQKVVRFGENGFLVRYRDRMFHESVFFADPDIFEVFTFPLLAGNPKTALKEPFSILISEEMRDKYFGNDDPVGKIITLNERRDFKISGVFKNIPGNSHFRFQFLGYFNDFAASHFDQWGIANYYTYILTSKDFSMETFQEKMPQFIEKYKGKKFLDIFKTSYFLQPLASIHLHSQLRNEIEPNRTMGTIYIFSVIALFILLIACLNYINLATARYVNRAKEVGLRKILGATRPQLIKQFLGESFLFAIIAMILAVFLVELFLPIFNALSAKKLEIHYFSNLFILPGIIGIMLLVGLFSGIFPALHIAMFQPINALKGIFKIDSKISSMRKPLVLFQFIISIVFVICSILIANQLHYIKTKTLGYDKENIINIPIYSKLALEKYETIKNEFLKYADISAVCASNFFPAKTSVYNTNYWHEGVGINEYPMISCLMVDADSLEAFRIKLIGGRNFSRQFPSDIERAFILNRSAVNEFGWTLASAIGKDFSVGGNPKGTVIGVVEDFHFESLQRQIRPLALLIYPQGFSHFSVRINPHNVPDAIRFIKNKWQELVPGQLFEYSFLDEDVDRLYKTEMRLGKIFLIAASLAIIIACLGLFGLAAFTAEQRTKEIGIRKVLGASASEIVLLLSKEFTRWVLLANIVAWPIAWYAMHKWLQSFAYRITILPWPFILAGLLAFLIALLTVSYKAIRAAAVNPVNALRYE